ncbi:MAG: sugar ABC transporter substrate-binding protein [Bacteroidetes bacterium]|nr:sugar ABC transporter substrate-binding protein [Bacteroidota bacterium]MBU1422369.1 sugar ABC transporter substrate-binding protein [Bacteroidota bacterium]MBU2635897.1 sugar ABC transporter substrate-binding protein [Bacteroidota bacterium]
MNRIFTYIIALLLSITISQLGCRPSTSSETVIVFWAMGAEGENVQKLIPEFERRNPDIIVKVQSIPWTAAHEKLLTAYAGNSTPDISQLGNTWIPEFTLLNAIEDLNPWIEKSSIVKKENYFEGIWDTNVMDGVPYGIPWYVDTRVMFYRKDILEQAGYKNPPATWDEWFDASLKIIQLAGGKEKYAVLLPTNEWVPFVVTGLQNGSTLLKDDNRYGDFSGEKFMKAFEFVMRFYEKKLAPVGITQVTNIYQGIAEGFFAMYITGPWNIGEFQKRMPPALQDKWMTAPLPGPDKNTPGVSLAGGASLVIFRNSTKKEQAWKFIEYLSAVQRQLEFYKVTGNLPAVEEAWNDTLFRNNVYVKAFYEQFKHVVPTPKIPEWEQIAMKVQQYAEFASAQKMSVTQALAELDKDVNIILEKRRWMLNRK